MLSLTGDRWRMIDFDVEYRPYSVESMGCAGVRQFSGKRGTRFRDADMMTRTKLACVQLERLKPYILRLRVVEALDRPRVEKVSFQDAQWSVLVVMLHKPLLPAVNEYYVHRLH